MRPGWSDAPAAADGRFAFTPAACFREVFRLNSSGSVRLQLPQRVLSKTLQEFSWRCVYGNRETFHFRISSPHLNCAAHLFTHHSLVFLFPLLLLCLCFLSFVMFSVTLESVINACAPETEPLCACISVN